MMKKKNKNDTNYYYCCCTIQRVYNVFNANQRARIKLIFFCESLSASLSFMVTVIYPWDFFTTTIVIAVGKYEGLHNDVSVVCSNEYGSCCCCDVDVAVMSEHCVSLVYKH